MSKLAGGERIALAAQGISALSGGPGSKLLGFKWVVYASGNQLYSVHPLKTSDASQVLRVVGAIFPEEQSIDKSLYIYICPRYFSYYEMIKVYMLKEDVLSGYNAFLIV